MNLYIIKPETEKEILAVNDLLIKMREEEARKEKIQLRENAIRLEIAKTIEELGLRETQKIVRSLKTELQNYPEELF